MKMSLKNMDLNISNYTNNAANLQTLQDQLTMLQAHAGACKAATILQAYADRRVEVVDSRESIKELERFFPFIDYRTVELTALAYRTPITLVNQLQGDIGYSCSYHVALWLQLAGIPCWLHTGNSFYQQKKQALQIRQNLASFLLEPHLTNHSSNLEQREKWQAQLSKVLLSAPESNRICELPIGEAHKAVLWKFKGNHLNEPDTKISQLLSSRSWHITKPLRFIARLLRKVI